MDEVEGETKKSTHLVTADGTYISQSALSTVILKKDEKMYVQTVNCMYNYVYRPR